MRNYIFTSESITEGHPDKVCDRTADSILGEALCRDPASKTTVEAMIKDDFVLIYDEANTKAKLEYEEIAKEVVREIGYTEEYEVLVKIHERSSEINHAVVQDDDEIDAGDQGVMFGYACNDTDNHIPAAIEYAHKLTKHLSDVHRGNALLLSNGKTQVSVEYENSKIKRIDTIVVSTQHVTETSQQQVIDIVMKDVITPIIPGGLLDGDTIYLINPNGSFVMGGSFGDSDTAGGKIVVDSHDDTGRIGGGCFSSKDPSKVGRGTAYYCRYAAENIMARQLASKCEVQVAHAIGKVKPVSVMVDALGTGNKSDEEVLDIIRSSFSFEVEDTIEELKLCRPIYKTASYYGRLGREEFSREKIEDLKYQELTVPLEGLQKNDCI